MRVPHIATIYLVAMYIKKNSNTESLGMTYWGSGDAKRDVALIKKAEEAAAKAFELDPEHKQATKHLKDLR
jgi:hypothetical protein